MVTGLAGRVEGSGLYSQMDDDPSYPPVILGVSRNLPLDADGRPPVFAEHDAAIFDHMDWGW